MSVNILLSGANGRMGRKIAAIADDGDIFRIVAGLDINKGEKSNASFPVFTDVSDLTANLPEVAKIHVIVDFSHHTALESLLRWTKTQQLPLVVATTGHTESELAAMKSASAFIPIFYSRNMSLGVSLMVELCRKAAGFLDGFDVEIIEKHHNKKLDAPSGTALMMADALSEALSRKYSAEYIYSRQPLRRERMPNEIGIHSVRGGTIVGEHEVLFAGNDEVISISHSAESRDVFARGALRAAAFITGKSAGLYNMSDIINSSAF